MARAVKSTLTDGTVKLYDHCEGHEDASNRVLRVFDPQAHHLNPLAVYDLDEIASWEYVEEYTSTPLPRHVPLSGGRRP